MHVVRFVQDSSVITIDHLFVYKPTDNCIIPTTIPITFSNILV